jgi:hypothetical protein
MHHREKEISLFYRVITPAYLYDARLLTPVFSNVFATIWLLSESLMATPGTNPATRRSPHAARMEAPTIAS